jgi:predicted Rossmann fold flavoprotein
LSPVLADVVVVGAGAAGMMCAAIAGQRGRRVILLDHASKLGEKIRISGGGRCNFTNLNTAPEHFISSNPHFCRSALARYSPQDFIALVKSYGIAYHEKHRGQLFCDQSSEQIIELLRRECERGSVQWRMPCSVKAIRRENSGFVVATDQGEISTGRVVIASGGMSIPKIGASDYGLRVARQFGLKIVEPRPALVPLTFAAEVWQPFSALAGVSLPVRVSSGDGDFLEDLLFTHRGLSGPAILQISSYWHAGQALCLDLIPTLELEAVLCQLKEHGRQQLGRVLQSWLPRRLAEGWLQQAAWSDWAECRLAEVPDQVLAGLGNSLQGWKLVPSGSEGWRKAEVMRGGVDTVELSQTTLEAKKVPGLHFVGEVVDVTGWLGGYNFQWAWASAHACGQAV